MRPRDIKQEGFMEPFLPEKQWEVGRWKSIAGKGAA